MLRLSEEAATVRLYLPSWSPFRLLKLEKALLLEPRQEQKLGLTVSWCLCLRTSLAL
jgi:hypothetical protein